MTLFSDFSGVVSCRLKQVALLTDRSQLSYGELLAMVGVLDRQLAARGVRPGQTLVLSTNRAEFTVPFALLLSLRSLRVIFDGVETVQRAGIGFDWAVAPEPMPTVAPERQIIMDAGWFADMGAAQVPDEPDSAGESGGEAGFVNRTSGSTGLPKYVLGSEAKWLRMIRQRYNFTGIPIEGRRLAQTAPASNGLALSRALTMLFAGGSVLMPGSDHDRLPAYLDLYHADILSTTPAILAQLLALPRPAQFLGGLQDIRVGGALTANSLLRALSGLCDARLHLVYGTTETDTGFLFRFDPATPQPEGFLGLPVQPELAVSFHAADQSPLPTEATEGILGFRFTDPAEIRHYLPPGPPGIPGKPIDGVFFPGDILRRDALGYHYVGRTGNIVNFSGEKYSLDRIAACLATAFGGRTIVPMVEPDAHGLECLVLVSEGPETPDIDAARTALAAEFPFAKVARCLAVARLPMTPTGKVDRLALQALLNEESAACPPSDPP